MKEETFYETVGLTNSDIVKRCKECGRVRVFYCKDDEFNFCDKCGRKVVNNVSYQHYYPQSLFNDCLDVTEED